MKEVIPVSKRTYRAVAVKSLVLSELESRFRGRRLGIGLDIAKTELKASVIDMSDDSIVAMWSWKAPDETRSFVRLVVSLSKVADVEVALEPTGTYGDVLRALLGAAGIPVFRVNPKHTIDASELYDGVPSQHDAKCASVVAWLHARKKSSPWRETAAAHRDLVAAADIMVLYDKQEHACVGRLEAKVARHFPELYGVLELGSATVLALLAQFGDPKSIAAAAAAARELMRRTGGPLLASDKIDRVIELARTTTGVPMTPGEREMMKMLAVETNRNRVNANAAAKHVEKLGANIESVRRVGEVIGKRTAAVLYAEAGDPGSYAVPAAYVKTLGLNLKIKNSGKPADIGRLKITKRGSSVARVYLYLAVLRLIQSDACFAAWYKRKAERDGGLKMKAIVALMRKLATALWHVARGQSFTPARLFDTERLGLAA